jgi:hypothetical protein
VYAVEHEAQKDLQLCTRLSAEVVQKDLQLCTRLSTWRKSAHPQDAVERRGAKG